VDQWDCGLNIIKVLLLSSGTCMYFDAKIPDEATAWIGKMSEGSGLDKNCSSCTIVRRSSLDFLALESVQQDQVFLLCYSFRIQIYSIHLPIRAEMS
jgi:hypothetical protein